MKIVPLIFTCEAHVCNTDKGWDKQAKMGWITASLHTADHLLCLLYVETCELANPTLPKRLSFPTDKWQAHKILIDVAD